MVTNENHSREYDRERKRMKGVSVECVAVGTDGFRSLNDDELLPLFRCGILQS